MGHRESRGGEIAPQADHLTRDLERNWESNLGEH